MLAVFIIPHDVFIRFFFYLGSWFDFSNENRKNIYIRFHILFLIELKPKRQLLSELLNGVTMIITRSFLLTVALL